MLRLIALLGLLATVVSGSQVTFADLNVPWDAPPHLDSTDNSLFSAVNSLLQRWPNTLYKNGASSMLCGNICFYTFPTTGHTIIPATMPIGTLLYHGHTVEGVPSVLEWVALDFEHAYLFCRQGPCYVVSFITTRDLRLAYFDGSSAIKWGNGTLDTQDMLTWGEPLSGRCTDEIQRIKNLCAWGKTFGLDGFVRMSYNFEVMVCDFSAGLKVVSVQNHLPKSVPELESEDDDLKYQPQSNPRPSAQTEEKPCPPMSRSSAIGPQPDPPGGWKGSLPEGYTFDFQPLVTGSWRNRSPGETRMHVDYSGLVTFYDTALASLIVSRRGVPRGHHRLLGISANDSARVHAELAEVFGRQTRGSGVDWGSVTRLIVERYAGRLETLRYTLEPVATFNLNATQQAALVRFQFLTMLVPYMTTDSVPTNASWTSSIVERCSTPSTSLIPASLLTPQERRIQGSVQGTLHEICRRLTVMWVDAFDIEAASEERAVVALENWRVHVKELMDWLGWSVWVDCNPACNPDAMCYLPSWPSFREGDIQDDMTPRCISSVSRAGQPTIWV
ncbi:hypothetical protein BV25DRAFT_986342 [Artomyces pyxidatus]|uniref:Uncharacterized protein n=1 Tax=Artomyces pyxidatus TaxID=48021 RepID=A0ACB8SVJ2_9AGAM|nr:hypothetical protein BV25DRAFT_986342 [Artomyces pyxidatus]